MTEVVMRDCAYCGEPFTYPKAAHRPPLYCSRVWPENPRTCQARARAKRQALRAAGMDQPLAAYQEAGDQVVPAIEALRETLTDHLDGVRGVESAALARAAEAERERDEAIDRAEAAETAAERAHTARQVAERDRKQAMDARHVAERLARDAERDRDEHVQLAWTRVVEQEGLRAAAEERAASQTAAAAHALDLRRAETERVEQLSKTNRELDKQLATTRTELAAANAARELAEHTATDRQEFALRAQAEARQAQDQATAATALLNAARSDHDRDQAVITELRHSLAKATRAADTAGSEIQSLREQLTRATADLQTARTDKTTADQRLDALTTALTTLGVTPPSDTDDDPATNR